jgi:hypothetical protein
MLLCGRVVVDRRGIDHAADSVMQDNKRECQARRQPVFVKANEDDHHEKVEVRLDVATREVREHGGGRQQAERDEDGAYLARPGNKEPCESECPGYQAAHQDALDDRKPHRDAKDRQCERVRGEQDEQEPVALRPDRGWQCVSARQQAARVHRGRRPDVNRKPWIGWHRRCLRAAWTFGPVELRASKNLSRLFPHAAPRQSKRYRIVPPTSLPGKRNVEEGFPSAMTPSPKP